jgi:putative nucleotidyltransferase with HDIG domain
MSLSFESIRQSPLSLHLIFYIIIYSLLLTLLSAVLQTTLEYRQGRQTIQANLQLIEDSYLQSIAASNYNVNEELLQVQLHGLIQLEDFVYAEITEPERAEAYRLSAGNPATRRDIVRTFPLRYQVADGKTYEIGTLTVAVNLDGLYSRLGERIMGILAENVLRIFLITLFMLFLTQSIITRHLSKIASYSDKVNLVQLEELTLERNAGKWFRPDEFDRLVAAINNMRFRLFEDREVLKKGRDDLRDSLEETVKSLASTAEKRDPYTAGHQQRVDRLACAIAKELGLPAQQIEGLHIAALLHDIGKIAVPAEYLAKPAKLSKVERSVIECHPEVGYEILNNIHFPWSVAEIVYQHHEHLDGSGYPRRLIDRDIFLEAKIIAVADVVEAMSTHRPYRPSLGITKALDEIRSGRGTRYHTPSVDACLHLILEKKIDFSIGA